jgi:cyclic lactone autoinducer peptide
VPAPRVFHGYTYIQEAAKIYQSLTTTSSTVLGGTNLSCQRGVGGMFRKILFFVITLLIVFAQATAAGACVWSGYQPKMPEVLRK